MGRIIPPPPVAAASATHAGLPDVTADQHHAQSHSHASHSGVGANDHHAQSHDHSAAADDPSIRPTTVRASLYMQTSYLAAPGHAGAGNLIANPSFEVVDSSYTLGSAIADDAAMVAAIPGWTGVDVPTGGEVDVAASVAGDGANRLGILNGNPSTTGRVMSDYFPVAPGATLIASMLLRGTGGNVGAAYGAGWFFWYKANFSASATTSSNAIPNYDVGSSTTWVRRTGLVTVPSDARWARFVCVLSSVSAADNFVGFDSVMVGDAMWGLVPPGAIMGWSGQTSAIPVGWFLCDGSNGTPDLRDRFIIGADATNEGTSGGTVSPSAALATHPTHAGHSGHGSHSSTAGHDHGAHTISAHVGAATPDLFSTNTASSGTGPAAHGTYAHSVEPGHSHDAHAAHSAHDAHGAHAVMNFYRLAYIMKA